MVDSADYSMLAGYYSTSWLTRLPAASSTISTGFAKINNTFEPICIQALWID